MIYSSSSIYAMEQYQDSLFLKRHLSFMLIGVVLMFIFMVVDYRKLRVLPGRSFYFNNSFSPCSNPGLGRRFQARRWFRFKFLSFQPSELASLAVIIYLADFIARKGNTVKSFLKGFVPPMAILGLASILILLQPDLGTTVALSFVTITLLFIAGSRLSFILPLLLSSLPFLYFLVFSVPYRKARIMAFINPWLDPKGSGFQVIQSQIALGSGGLFGVGLGHSKQKLFYLPAAHTDFIFSIIGEELGLLGTIGVVILFIIFIQQGIKIIKNAPDKFSYFLSLGLVLMISFRAMINIGVSCGILPTKGLPLPFISYGGTSFIFDMISVGILANIARIGDYP